MFRFVTEQRTNALFMFGNEHDGDTTSAPELHPQVLVSQSALPFFQVSHRGVVLTSAALKSP